MILARLVSRGLPVEESRQLVRQHGARDRRAGWRGHARHKLEVGAAFRLRQDGVPLQRRTHGGQRIGLQRLEIQPCCCGDLVRNLRRPAQFDIMATGPQGVERNRDDTTGRRGGIDAVAETGACFTASGQQLDLRIAHRGVDEERDHGVRCDRAHALDQCHRAVDQFEDATEKCPQIGTGRGREIATVGFGCHPDQARRIGVLRETDGIDRGADLGQAEM